MSGPKQEPDNSEHGPTWENWEDWRLPEKTTGSFKYSDGTEQHIDRGESQYFHYEGNDLPEKM